MAARVEILPSILSPLPRPVPLQCRIRRKVKGAILPKEKREEGEEEGKLFLPFGGAIFRLPPLSPSPPPPPLFSPEFSPLCLLLRRRQPPLLSPLFASSSSSSSSSSFSSARGNQRGARTQVRLRKCAVSSRMGRFHRKMGRQIIIT